MQVTCIYPDAQAGRIKPRICIGDSGLDAAIEDLVLFYKISKRLANSNEWPQWFEGNEFRAIREASLTITP